MLRLTTLFICLLFSSVSQGEEIDLTWRLQARNHLHIAKEKTKPYFRDREVQYRLRQWLAIPANRAYVTSCQEHLSPFFHSYNVLASLCWAKHQNKVEEIKWLLTHYYLDLAISLLELHDDPRYDQQYKNIASKFFVHFQDYKQEIAKITTCFQRQQNVDIVPCLEQNFTMLQRPKHHLYTKLSAGDIYADDYIPYFALNTAQTFPYHLGHANSETGWIKGNNTRYLTTQNTVKHLGKGLNATSDLISTHYPLAGKGSLSSMYRALKRKGYQGVFTESGFKLVESDVPELRDPFWNQKEGVYTEVVKLINSAKETIFIDMFALGGVSGVSISKLLLSRLEKNPRLKIFILRDIINHFGSFTEQMPVYNYLLAYSYLFPNRLIVSESYIYGHISGLPNFIKAIIDDELVKMSGMQSMLDLAVQAVSDHSKLIVVDGKSKNPKALVSSKNWSDRAGAYFFDDAVVIEGAGAAVVQDDFYHDMRVGLKKTMAVKYVKGKIRGQDSYINLVYQGEQRDASLDYKISEILKDFDLLERDENLTPRVAKVSYPQAQGTAMVRSGFNNVDSTTTQIVDQNIQAILLAKKNIYINEQFCFDTKIVTALLNVKERRPHLDIRLILEQALETEPDGIPNSLYLDLLIASGIQVRWKKTRWIGNIPQKNHSKSLSIDSRYVLVGSANKDSMTMFGSFRDQQMGVFSPATAKEHDRIFLAWWENVDENRTHPLSRNQYYDKSSYDTEEVNPYAFQVPKFFVGFDGEQLQPKEFLRLTRGIVKLLYDYVVL